MNKSLPITALILFCSPAIADFSLDLNAEAESKTNVNRSATEPVDDLIYRYGGNLSAMDSGAHYAVDINYNTRRETYQDETFDPVTRTTGSGNFQAFNASESLSWYLSNTLNETAFNIFAPEAGGNLNRVSTTASGVSLKPRLSGRDALAVSAGKVWVDSENPLLDSTADIIESRLTHGLNTRSSLGIVASYTYTSPDADAYDDFSEHRIAAFGERRHRNGTASFQFGVVNTDLVTSSGEELGYLTEYELRFTTNNPITNIELSGGRKLASSGMGALSDTSFTPAGSDEFQVNIREYYRADFNYELKPNKVSLYLFADQNNEENQYDTLYRDIQSIGGGLNYRLLYGSFNLYTQQVKRDEGFETGSTGSQTETRVGLSYGSESNRSLGWRCGVERSDYEEDVVSESVRCNINYSVF